MNRAGSYRARKKHIKLLLTVIMSILAITMVIPFVWMVSASFKPDNEIFDFPIKWIPKHLLLKTMLRYGLPAFHSICSL